MPQDITPNNDQQSATTTNTMSPKNISAQSAGSITPTIISQSNADRRRRANNERERRSRQNLSANVERSEIEREYRRLREEERKANERAEARKRRVESERVWYYSGGSNSPLKRVEMTLGEYMKTKLSGAAPMLETPTEYANYINMSDSNNSDNTNAGYRGLNKLADHINSLLKTEAQENRQIEGARASIAALQGSSVSAPTYSPMSEEAVAAHIRIANDPNTDAETRQRLISDLQRDTEYVKSHGGTNLSSAQEKYLSENVYSGGSSVSKELKTIAGDYLAAAGSTYGKADFNKSADSIYASQAGKQRAALEKRWGEWSTNELNQIGIDAKTREAIKTNQTLAGKAVSAIDTARLKAVSSGDQSSSFAAYNAEKQMPLHGLSRSFSCDFSAQGMMWLANSNCGMSIPVRAQRPP